NPIDGNLVGVVDNNNYLVLDDHVISPIVDTHNNNNLDAQNNNYNNFFGQNHQLNPHQNSVTDNNFFGDNNNNLDAQNNNYNNFFGRNHQFNPHQNSVTDNNFFGDNNNNLDIQTRILIAAQLQNIINQLLNR
ncbi:6719_t:CDS:2, partial [Entrophospora sp. SA101]